MELVEFVAQAAQPGIGVYAAKVRPTASGFHFEIELDGLDDPMGAVSLDDCGVFSRAVTTVIDELLAEAEQDGSPLPAGLSEDNYTLEVSSAGAERMLRLPRDLERFAGKALRLRFVQDDEEYNERVLYVGADEADGSEEADAAERKYLFKEYIGRRKKKGSGRAGKNGVFPPAPEYLRLRLKQIIKANLFLDF